MHRLNLAKSMKQTHIAAPEKAQPSRCTEALTRGLILTLAIAEAFKPFNRYYPRVFHC